MIKFRGLRGLSLYAMITVICLSLTVVGWVSYNSRHADDVRSVPVCATDNGAESELCWHHDRESGWVLNVNHGAYTFVTDTGDVVHLPN